MSMNLRVMRYLVEVARHRHFGKAAEASYVSQPTLSMQLKKLEDYLGVTLFERDNKNVNITPVGEIIAEHAARILIESEEIIAIGKAAQDPYAGLLRLGAIPTIAPYFLPHIVPLIAETHPDIKLWLKEEKTDTLLKMLQQGTLDAALMALPIEENGLEEEVLFHDPFYLAVHSEHVLAKEKSITIDALKDESLLLLDEGHCFRDQALDVCSKTSVKEQQNFRATSIETLRQMVGAKVGVTLVPKMAIGAQHDPRLSYIPFDRNYERKIGLVWRKTTWRKEAIDSIKGLVKENVPE